MLSANHPTDSGSAPRPHLDVEVTVGDDNVALVRLRGELDFSCYDLATERMAAVDHTGAPEVVVDLSELDFIDSSGIRLISLAERRCAARGAVFRLRGATGPVRRVLDLTGVSERLRLD